jgi:hypothetical protein
MSGCGGVIFGFLAGLARRLLRLCAHAVPASPDAQAYLPAPPCWPAATSPTCGAAIPARTGVSRGCGVLGADQGRRAVASGFWDLPLHPGWAVGLGVWDNPYSNNHVVSPLTLTQTLTLTPP